MSATVRHELPLIVSGQDGTIKYGESMQALDALVCCSVLQKDLDTPPTGAAGDVYLVGSSPTGVWADFSGQLVQFVGTSWVDYTPANGQMLWDFNLKALWVHDSTNWYRLSERIFAAQAVDDQTITGTSANIAWKDQLRYPSDVFTHSESTNPHQITLKEIGTYEITLTVHQEQTAAASWTTCDYTINLDGSAIAAGSLLSIVTHNTNAARVTGSRTIVVTTAAVNKVLTVSAIRAAGTGTINTEGPNTFILIRKLTGV